MHQHVRLLLLLLPTTHWTVTPQESQRHTWQHKGRGGGGGGGGDTRSSEGSTGPTSGTHHTLINHPKGLPQNPTDIRSKDPVGPYLIPGITVRTKELKILFQPLAETISRTDRPHLSNSLFSAIQRTCLRDSSHIFGGNLKITTLDTYRSYIREPTPPIPGTYRSWCLLLPLGLINTWAAGTHFMNTLSIRHITLDNTELTQFFKSQISFIPGDRWIRIFPAISGRGLKTWRAST